MSCNRKYVSLFFVVMVVILYASTSCSSKGYKYIQPGDTSDSGTIYISADESFKPVIDAQVEVFENSYPNAHINVLYKPEASCIDDLSVDSIRMAIITRRYTEGERQYLVDSMHASPSNFIVAFDAIAVIVNPLSPDSLFTMKDIKQVLKGNFKKTLIPVFDGLKATSTVRFIIDSILRGDSLTKLAIGAKNSDEVLDYVSKTPDAVGFIGVSWIGNKEDPQQVSFLKKVKMAQLESKYDTGKYILPVQANIYTGRYPMTRSLVYILKESHNGLGIAFANFMKGERGQLIFRRAYLLPARQTFVIRRTELKEEYDN